MGLVAKSMRLSMAAPVGLRRWSMVAVVLTPMLLPAGRAYAADPSASPYPINQQIMYGNVVKTPAMVASDKAFIDEFAAHGVSRQQGSNEMVERGWTAMNSGDVPTSIRRFNQAWLLDSDNYAVYWGFAVVLFARDRDVTGAERMFNTAVAKKSDDPKLLVDYAQFLSTQRRFDEAIRTVDTALAIEPRTRNAHAVLAISYLSTDFGRALEHAKIARYRGEGVGFAAMPILACLLDKGIERSDDPRARECLPAGTK